MSGELRGDYFQWLLEWEKKADLCLTLGTSLAGKSFKLSLGMNADRVAASVAKRLVKRNRGFGECLPLIEQELLS